MSTQHQIVIRRFGSDEPYEAWLWLGGDFEPPYGNSVCLGWGRTEDEAKADAVSELEALIEQLQQPAGE